MNVCHSCLDGISETEAKSLKVTVLQSAVVQLLSPALCDPMDCSTPDILASNKMIKQAAERAAINAPLQGSAADVIKLAMIAVDKVLPKDQAKLLLQVHDELVFEADADIADELSKQIADVMQSVLEISVPFVVEVGQGQNWDAAH